MSGKASDIGWLFSRQTVTAQHLQPIRASLRLMVRRGFRHLPVVDENSKVVGILSAQDIIDALYLASREIEIKSKEIAENVLALLSKPLKEIMSTRTSTLGKNCELLEIIRVMSENNVGAVPIVDGNNVIQGIITLRDLVFLMWVSPGRLGVSVSDIMTPNPALITSSQRVLEAIAVMSTRKVRRLPVVASTAQLRNVEGVVSNKDVLRYLESDLTYNLMELVSRAFLSPVTRIMTWRTITISPNEDVRTAAYMMMTLGIGGLIVTDGEMVGVITERDLINKLYRIRGNDFMKKAIVPAEDTSDRPSW